MVKNSFLNQTESVSQYKFRKLLQNTRNSLKQWNKIKNNNEINQIRQECVRLQDIIAFYSSEPMQINNFFHMQKKLVKELHVEVVNLKQKAKIDRLTSGDTLSKVFCAKMLSRKYNNDMGKSRKWTCTRHLIKLIDILLII